MREQPHANKKLKQRASEEQLTSKQSPSSSTPSPAHCNEVELLMMTTLLHLMTILLHLCPAA